MTEFLICDKCFQNKHLQSKIEAKIKELESEKFELGWSETFEERRNKIKLLNELLQEE